MDENAFERYFRSGKTAINIAEAAEYVIDVQKELIRSGNNWDNADVRTAFEKKYEASNFSLQGIPRIVGGRKPTVAITHNQFHAIEGIFGIDPASVIGRNIHVIVSSTSSGQIEKTKLLWIHARSPLDQIIISQGLANMLKLKVDEQIQIEDIEEDTSDLDLDQLR